MRNIFRLGLLPCAFVASVFLVGCSGKSPAQLMESSKALMQQKDYNAASIELKNVLQQDANNVEARFLLGKSLLEVGRSSEALIELSKARELGYPVAQLAAPIGSAMLSLGEAEQFVAEYAGVKIDDPKLRAEFKTTLSMAYGSQRKYSQSREAADDALQADPKNVTANLLVAQLLRVAGDNAGALAQIERTIASTPEAGEPWLAKADQLLATNADPAGILAAYREALRRIPQDPRVHAGITQELIRQQDLDGAQRQLAQLEKLQPKGVQGRYLAATLAYKRRDWKTAFEAVQELLRVGPNNTRFLHLAGAIEYERGNYLQSAAHLGKALNDPSAPDAVRVLLARAQLRSGEPVKALAALQPLLDGSRRPPAEVYSLAADCYTQKGDKEAAKKMYAKAVEANPADERGRTVMALSALSEGRTEQAMSELKSIAGSASGIDAEFALIMTHVRNNRLDDALAVVDGVERKRPRSAIAPYFRGRIEQLRGRRDKAREWYERAVTRDASYAPAVVALAVFDLDDARPANAVARYEKLVAAAPQDVGARLGLIAARARAGAKPENVREQLEEVVKLFPDSESARITLTGTLLDQRDSAAALKAARDGLVRLPDSLGLLQAQGLAELVLGNYNQAAQSFSKAATLKPNAVEPLMYLVDVQMARNDFPAAIAQLRKVIAIRPDYMPAQTRLVSLLTRLSKSDEAMSVAKGVQKQFPADPTGWSLEADLLTMKGNHASAVMALNTAFSKRPSDETVVRLYKAMSAASQTAEADKLANDWLAKHPDSVALNIYLGEQATVQRDYERAEKHFRKVVAGRSPNALVLNNLAWVLYRAGKPGALEMGEKALALAPDSDAILDTVAEIHAAGGRMDKAVTLQKRAVDVSPNMPVLRMHLAQYLIKNGQKQEARAELERLAALGRDFAAQDEVKKLLASL
ncbi:MAG: PEP-CTERM system TPR-repeat protein PrsT [Roseateles depolymerans]|uniref:PEP-CTERM system TPR-repeat protein PrsT n=1 Tax=Roseateles depolymerans TaxID=76731 RepID=A0A2W5D8F1_9BURK|nr:MAG: PEP-CTERM system TPR-repeat protein PrsT [Roseateles depolymerans]